MVTDPRSVFAVQFSLEEQKLSTSMQCEDQALQAVLKDEAWNPVSHQSTSFSPEKSLCQKALDALRIDHMSSLM